MKPIGPVVRSNLNECKFEVLIGVKTHENRRNGVKECLRTLSRDVPSKGLVLIFTQNALFGEKVVLAAKICEVIKTSTFRAGYSGLTTRPARL